jgi:hypothetical protein
MPNNLDSLLSVTLDKSGPHWFLHVNEVDHPNFLNAGPNPQGIVWTLMGDAATGSFLPLLGPELGFAWVGPQPHACIFDAPFLPANNQLRVLDRHTGPGTAGTWTYILRARINGTVYSTTALSAAAQNTNPRIKNN